MRLAMTALSLALISGAAWAADDHSHHQHHSPSQQPEAAQAAQLRLVETDLTDRHGRTVKFPGQVLGRDLVVMDFVYTSCTTTCLMTSAMMADLEDRLVKAGRRDVRLISLSLDPARDTPERMDSFARRFDPKAGWLWITGDKPAMEGVLKGLGTYTADVVNHAPALIVGDPVTNTWRRFNGVVASERVMAELDRLAQARLAMRTIQGKEYFGDVPVVDRNGRSLRFWSDVLEGHTVLLSLFYTSCDGTCPMVAQKLAEVQDLLGDHLGKGIRMVSVSVDPEVDTPKAMDSFAKRFDAKPGWMFLSGKPDEHRALVRKLGHLTDEAESHTAVLMAGNVKSGKWIKLPPNLDAQSIADRLVLLAGTR